MAAWVQRPGLETLFVPQISCEYEDAVGYTSDPNYRLQKKVIAISEACDLGSSIRTRMKTH